MHVLTSNNMIVDIILQPTYLLLQGGNERELFHAHVIIYLLCVMLSAALDIFMSIK